MKNTLPQESIDCILAPLLTPSGIWADFNVVWYLWFSVEGMVKDGLIPREQLPPQPDPADYTDYVSERTIFMPPQGFRQSYRQ